MSTLWPWGWGQERVLPRTTSQGLGPALLPSPRTQKVAYAGRTMGAPREKQKGRPKVRPAPSCHLHNHVAHVCLSVLHFSPNCSRPRESLSCSHPGSQLPCCRSPLCGGTPEAAAEVHHAVGLQRLLQKSTMRWDPRGCSLATGIRTGKCVPFNSTVKTCEIFGWCPVEVDDKIPR